DWRSDVCSSDLGPGQPATTPPPSSERTAPRTIRRSSTPSRPPVDGSTSPAPPSPTPPRECAVGTRETPAQNGLTHSTAAPDRIHVEQEHPGDHFPARRHSPRRGTTVGPVPPLNTTVHAVRAGPLPYPKENLPWQASIPPTAPSAPTPTRPSPPATSSPTPCSTRSPPSPAASKVTSPRSESPTSSPTPPSASSPRATRSPSPSPSSTNS